MNSEFDNFCKHLVECKNYSNCFIAEFKKIFGNDLQALKQVVAAR